MKFGNSELILNPDGSAYHINLRPEEVFDHIITVGDPDRVERFLPHFNTVYFKKSAREFKSLGGHVNGRDILVISTGIGPDNIDIVYNELDACVNIDFETRTPKATKKSLNILRVGTSGALIDEIEVDSFLVSKHGIGLDNLLHFYQLQQNETEMRLEHQFNTLLNPYLPKVHAYAVSGSEKLLQSFSHYRHGITLTAPGFYAPQGRELNAKNQAKNYLDALMSFEFEGQRFTNFEMETSAKYGLGRVLGHHALSINVIIANRATKQFSEKPKASVDKLIEESLKIITTSQW